MAARSAAWSWFMCVMVLAFCTGSISRALPAGETCWARGVEGDERETERVVTMLGDRGTYGTRQRGSDLLQCFHRFGLLSVRSKVLNSEFVYSIDLSDVEYWRKGDPCTTPVPSACCGRNPWLVRPCPRSHGPYALCRPSPSTFTSTNEVSTLNSRYYALNHIWTCQSAVTGCMPMDHGYPHRISMGCISFNSLTSCRLSQTRPSPSACHCT